jgi:hypothetical protein
MSIPERIKVGAAALLLVCLLLPFSSCQRPLDADGRSTFVSKEPAVKVLTESRRIWTDFEPTRPWDWVGLLCFLWPIPVLIHRHRSSRQTSRRILWALEPLLLGGSSFYLWFLSHFLETPAIGAYLAETANLAYGAAWAAEFANAIKRREKGDYDDDIGRSH